MQSGWEFKVNAFGRTWYEHAGLRQVQKWRPELHEDKEVVEEDDDPENVAQREAAAAAAALIELVSSLKLRQADLMSTVNAQQNKLELLIKALKTKKGDALNKGQVQQQALEKEIKDMQKDLAVTKAQIADAQKRLPATSKSVANNSQPSSQSGVVGDKTALSGLRSKPVSHANTMGSSKKISLSFFPSAKVSAPARPAPVARSSTITSVSSSSVSGSSTSLQSPAAKTAPVPVAEIKEFGRTADKLDVKLLTISDEVCLSIHDQMWAPIKKLSFLPIMDKLPSNSAISSASSQADNKKSSSSSIASSPSKTMATTPVKATATPLSRVSGSAIPSPLSSARK